MRQRPFKESFLRFTLGIKRREVGANFMIKKVLGSAVQTGNGGSEIGGET